MTEIAFHFNISDDERGKLNYACRLLRKAYAQGARVGVLAAPEALEALDAALWTFSQRDFIPHCTADAPEHIRSATPIMLASACEPLQHCDVLLHLGQGEAPEGFERFERLIELVSSEAADRQGARARWRYYAERGYSIKTHDAAAQRAAKRSTHD